MTAALPVREEVPKRLFARGLPEKAPEDEEHSGSGERRNNRVKSCKIGLQEEQRAIG